MFVYGIWWKEEDPVNRQKLLHCRLLVVLVVWKDIILVSEYGLSVKPTHFLAISKQLKNGILGIKFIFRKLEI